MANLKNHVKDFNIDAEYHFTATAHGKLECDGLGAAFKRGAYRASLKAKATEAIININSLKSWAKNRYKNIEIFYFSRTEHERCQRHLNNRFENAERIVGISKNNSFIVSDNRIVMNTYSKIN